MLNYLYVQGFTTIWIEHLHLGVQAAQQMQDKRDEGAHLGHLGLAYRDLGQVEKAISFYEQALEIARQTGYRYGEGLRAWNLGSIYEESDPAKAVKLMSIRVTYEQEIGHPDAKADAQRVAKLNN